MSEWQPIETAPKDGTTILLWLRERQNSGGRRTAYPVIDDLRVGHWVITDGYGRWRYLTNGYAYGQDNTFTHWMPLPEPPK
jgi:hypothetical protein